MIYFSKGGTVIDKNLVTKVIIESFAGKFLPSLELDMAICGAGPSECVAACFLTKQGLRMAELIAGSLGT